MNKVPAATPSPISTIAKAPAMIAKVQDLLRHIFAVVVVYLKCQLELLVVYGFGLKEQQEQ